MYTLQMKLLEIIPVGWYNPIRIGCFLFVVGLSLFTGYLYGRSKK